MKFKFFLLNLFKFEMQHCLFERTNCNEIYLYEFFSYVFRQIEQHDTHESCYPNPCGMNSQCRVINEHVACSCIPGYIGSAPNCRPECVVSSECSQNRACIHKKCVDPCISVCGQNARCHVVNHNPICSCSSGFTGDPFVRCISQRKCMCNVHKKSISLYLFYL